MFIEIIGAVALLAIIGLIIYKRSQQSHSPEYNSDYLVAGRSFTLNGERIDRYYTTKQEANYAKLLGVDTKNARQCGKWVIINVPEDEDVNHSPMIDAFWKKKMRRKLIPYARTHIIIQKGNKFFGAVASISPAGIKQSITSLDDNYCWPFSFGNTILRPRLTV